MSGFSLHLLWPLKIVSFAMPLYCGCKRIEYRLLFQSLLLEWRVSSDCTTHRPSVLRKLLESPSVVRVLGSGLNNFVVVGSRRRRTLTMMKSATKPNGRSPHHHHQRVQFLSVQFQDSHPLLHPSARCAGFCEVGNEPHRDHRPSLYSSPLSSCERHCVICANEASRHSNHKRFYPRRRKKERILVLRKFGIGPSFRNALATICENPHSRMERMDPLISRRESDGNPRGISF
jgi:hypothetical protein